MGNCNFAHKLNSQPWDGNTAVEHAVSPIMTNETEDHILSECQTDVRIF